MSLAAPRKRGHPSMKKKATNASRVAAAKAAAIARGARRIGPLLIYDQVAIAALDRLAGELGTQRAALEHALRTAAPVDS